MQMTATIKLPVLIFLILLMETGSLCGQTISVNIVTDQFGYTKNASKVAVLRSPKTGFDAPSSYNPGTIISLKNAVGNATVFSAAPVAYKAGITDPASGDKVWWFDFSSVQTEGTYYVLDETNNARSATFIIADTVYKNVLKAAVKSFYYQRAGFAKTAAYAGIGWADGASHTGPLQDKNCRIYNDHNNAATEKDLSGGWYDAGDYNKYTPWTANYIVALLHSYKENPSLWTDDLNIPESGNGIPDLMDEVKWGMDWLLKMQQANGSSLCVMGLATASPPSAAGGQSTYGPATTNATMRSAAAFALGAKYFRQANPVYFGIYADTLAARAALAYNWAISNPSIIFNNNSAANGSQGLGAGNQETDSLGRFTAKMAATLYLYDLTGTAAYLTQFENGASTFPLLAWGNYVSQYFQESQQLLFYYLGLPGINTALANQIKAATLTAAKKPGDFAEALTSQADPYRAFIKDYNWGSNQYKSDYGNFLWQLQFRNIEPANNNYYLRAAEEYLHYIHGVNPLQFVYLSNMGSYGAEKNIKEFYHSWFTNGSLLWDREGVSTYGPAPGFLTGGPNVFYTIDGCCPSGCGSAQNNAACNAESTSPPTGQPAMKAYKDFNTGWPLNSWQVTENSNGYQVAYIRLLSKYTSNAADDSTVISVVNGNWNSPATWQGGVVPAVSSKAVVRHNVTVTANASVWSVKVEPASGNLVVQTGVVLNVLH
jgi:endoglucanase